MGIVAEKESRVVRVRAGIGGDVETHMPLPYRMPKPLNSAEIGASMRISLTILAHGRGSAWLAKVRLSQHIIFVR
ncbi:hypothetical protein MSAR_21270 [Mycolicibacterium sarraceniae]|uniref:Uncharacterized protein n=1 Tax=Mycolicibacterium sarraceniae TaxID=1534348 RepID=A0A7I7SRJ2_9MYCO|nr:hypothetical protein MSAR_21270 [Mycolicibacterium sarraceniae]